MKSIKKYCVYLVLILVGVLVFSDDVYADDQYKCLYEGILSIEYNPVNGKASYQEIDIVNDSCGTASNSCKALDEVFDTKIFGKLDLDKWDFFGTGNIFSCPIIFSSVDCDNENAYGQKICYYNFAPSIYKKEGITIESSSSINGSMTSNNDNIDNSGNYCNDAQKSAFVSEMNSVANNYVTEIASYISSIQDNQTADYYSNYFNNILYKNIGYANTNATVSYRKATTACLMDLEDERYKASVNYLSSVVNAQSQNYLDALISKTEEAKSKNGDTNGEYSTLLSTMHNEKEVLTGYSNSYKESLNEFYESYLDRYAPVDKTCEGILSPDLVDIINEIMTIIRIAVPILLIVLGTVDFSKAVLFQEKDESKKAISTFIKRCLIAIVIFFVPTVIHILVDIFNSVSDIPITDLKDCGIR